MNKIRKIRSTHPVKIFGKTKIEEKELIDGCIAGKRQMQKHLYDNYAGKMMAVCLRYSKTTFEAEDIMQEGFMKVFKNIGSFKGDCPLEFWIRRIMVNTALRLHRNKSQLSIAADPEQIEAVPEDELILSNYGFEELMQLVQSLAPRYQLIFNLYAIEGFNHREIAEQLDISEGTSKSQYSRARAILKDKLEHQKKIFHEKIVS